MRNEPEVGGGRFQRSATAVGERRKPRPEGRPGFVRVDSLHQGDLDGHKGVYVLNEAAGKQRR